MKKYYFLLLFGLLLGNLSAQEKEPLQLSGVVVSADSIPRPIPFANVYIPGGKRGTMTDADGFFSLAVLPGDTFKFSCIGFKQEELIVPDSLLKKAYLARVVMKRDTTMLNEVTLYPWPSRDRFKEAFMSTQIPTTQNDIAMRNLAVQALKDRAAAMGFSPEEVQDFAIQMQNQQIYNHGRYQGFDNGGTAILGALTNPFAWQQFFQTFKK